jgi:putative membrane protein
MISGKIAAILAVCAVGVFAAPPSGQLSPADRHFLTTAADANMMEAHVGQMAESQAAGANLKDLGKKLADDHSKLYGEELQLAQKVGDTIPRGINVKREPSVAQLTKLQGAQFDRTFLRDEIADHERALAAFQREAQHGKNPEVKAWAAKAEPILKEHLNMAKELAKFEGSARKTMAAKRT